VEGIAAAFEGIRNADVVNREAAIVENSKTMGPDLAESRAVVHGKRRNDWVLGAELHDQVAQPALMTLAIADCGTTELRKRK
jgi:hypothetical protein